MKYLVVFLLGLIFGSFTSVVIVRLRSGERGILAGRSHCPECRHRLGAADLVPVLSYAASRGKCRHCGKGIPAFYPLLELGMGAAFLTTGWLAGFDDYATLAVLLAMTFFFVLLSVYDGLYQEVPDEISLPAIVFFLIAFPLLGLHGPWDGLKGLIVPTLFFGLLFFGSRGKWLGGGDLRIGGIMGAILGHPRVLLGLFLGYLLGALFSVAGLATGKLTRKTAIPFAPFLLLGTYVAFFWGEGIMDWYWGMMD